MARGKVCGREEGAWQAESSHARDFKRATKELKKNKQIAINPGHFFSLTFPWHWLSEVAESRVLFITLRICILDIRSINEEGLRAWWKSYAVSNDVTCPTLFLNVLHGQSDDPILNTLIPPALKGLHLLPRVIYTCPYNSFSLPICFSLARHASGIPEHLLAEAATLLAWLKPCWLKCSSIWFFKGLLLHPAGIQINFSYLHFGEATEYRVISFRNHVMIVNI